MPQDMRALFNFLLALKSKDWILAYHDRSDGGLLVSLLEMAFAGRCGLQVDLAVDHEVAVARLFSRFLPDVHLDGFGQVVRRDNLLAAARRFAAAFVVAAGFYRR